MFLSSIFLSKCGRCELLLFIVVAIFREDAWVTMALPLNDLVVMMSLRGRETILLPDV